jgi:vitamin B12/bleomycin/antimicrobial peptide transport system ATP-binding/permease protein
VTDWSSVLSIGEQQRISFARVLLAKPQIVLMDESTSALDTDNEKLMYDLLDKSDVSFVSVGHRPSLTDFHDTILRLESDGRWEVKPLR